MSAGKTGGGRPPMVSTLSGTPREVGTAFGTMHREALRQGQTAWLERGAEHGLSRDDLLRMAAPMLEVGRVGAASAQLEEVSLLARSVEPATANGGLAMKLSPSQTTLGRHCASAVPPPQAESGKQPLLDGTKALALETRRLPESDRTLAMTRSPLS